MEAIRIPCIVWFPGDPPPDVSGFSDPIRIPFTFRPDMDTPAPSQDRIVPVVLGENGPTGEQGVAAPPDYAALLVSTRSVGSKRATATIPGGPAKPMT